MNQPKNKEQEKKEQAQEAIKEALEESRKLPFGKRVSGLFYGSIFCTSVAVFSVIFGVLAILILPILLPCSYILSAFRGKQSKFDGILSR